MSRTEHPALTFSPTNVTRQIANASAFRALHTVGDPVVLFNAWDAGSATAIAAAGAKAIATGSWSVASAHGSNDGEQLPLELVLANLARIANTVDLPVTLDFERGYGETPADVGRSVAAAISAGAIGFNIEDSSAGGLRTADEQAARLAAARAAAERAAVPVFVNAHGPLSPDPVRETQRCDDLRRNRTNVDLRCRWRRWVVRAWARERSG